MIAHILRNPAQRAAIERALAAKGNHGDSLLAHLNPAEAQMLKQAGGSGTVNPKTGLLQFDPTGGSNAGGAGHAGDSGHNGGTGDGGSGHIGGGLGGDNGGYNGQGRGFSGPAGGTQSGPYGGHLGGNTAGGAQMGSAAAYAHTGGIDVNPGRTVGGLLGSALGPLGGILGSLAGGWASDQLGGNFTIGGTDNRISDGAPGGWGGGSPGNVGANNGQNGEGQRPGNPGSPGSPGSPTSGGQPAAGQPPAGLPPAMNPALASLFYGGQTGADPFNGRFGPNGGLLRYLIAQNQPSGSQLLG